MSIVGHLQTYEIRRSSDMRTASRIWVTVLAGFSFLTLATGAGIQEYKQLESDWSEPRQLSSAEAEASEAYMTADGAGYLHIFWVENGFDHERSLIQYSRFDGVDWTTPIDIYASWPGKKIGSVSPTVDAQGMIHLVWSEGNSGPLYYSRASIYDAYSAKGWTEPVEISVPAKQVSIKVDADQVLHVIYTDVFGESPGIYYTRSANAGRSWSSAVQLDPDIPSDAFPRWLDVELDDSNGLHIIWEYDDGSFVGRWIRYSHSLDGGIIWSEPFSIDVASAEEQDEIHMPRPGLAAAGNAIHGIWGGAREEEENRASVNRRYRFSLDRGVTWSDISPILGELKGQAGGDGLAFDGDGRLHFVGQLRWPQGIYHAVFDDGKWSEAELAYLIRENSSDDFGSRIHAHNVRLAMRGGNQLVAAFTTDKSVQSVLYTIQSTLEDTQSIPTLQQVQEIGESQSEGVLTNQFLSATPAPKSSIEPLTSVTLNRTQPRTPTQNNTSLTLGSGLALLVVAGVVIGQIVVRKI